MGTELSAGVYWLDPDWPGPFGTLPRPPFPDPNAFIVDDGTLTLVDSGLPWMEASLRSELAAVGVRPEAIDRVLITHFDLDHYGGLRRLAPELDAPVVWGAADLHLATGQSNPPSTLRGIAHRGLRRLYPLPADLTYETVTLGTRIGGFSAHHTPGHPPGHMCYVHAELGAAFLGDLVWSTNGRLRPGDEIHGVYDTHQLLERIQRLAKGAPPFEMACAGHGRPIETRGDRALRRLAEQCPPSVDGSGGSG